MTINNDKSSKSKTRILTPFQKKYKQKKKNPKKPNKKKTNRNPAQNPPKQNNKLQINQTKTATNLKLFNMHKTHLYLKFRNQFSQIIIKCS